MTFGSEIERVSRVTREVRVFVQRDGGKAVFLSRNRVYWSHQPCTFHTNIVETFDKVGERHFARNLST